jgi:hypothetical protein
MPLSQQNSEQKKSLNKGFPFTAFIYGGQVTSLWTNFAA